MQCLQGAGGHFIIGRENSGRRGIKIEYLGAPGQTRLERIVALQNIVRRQANAKLRQSVLKTGSTLVRGAKTPAAGDQCNPGVPQLRQVPSSLTSAHPIVGNNHSSLHVQCDGGDANIGATDFA